MKLSRYDNRQCAEEEEERERKNLSLSVSLLSGSVVLFGSQVKVSTVFT